MPNGSTNPDSTVCRLEHKFRDTYITVNMETDLVDASLLSMSKLAITGYIKVYNGK